MWDDVELLTSDDTGSGQLTIRSRQECGSALYQMNTLVKITSSKKVLSNPELNAYNLSDGCVLVADRTVVVLDNICQSLQMFIHFETEVDIVGLCQEGQFLVAGERSGNLHLIQVSSKQTLLTKALVQSSFDEKVFLDLILEMDSSVEGTYHAFILTSKGFFCIMHLPLANIQKAIIEMDISAAKKLQSQVETCFISVEDYHTAGCFTSVTKDTANTFALIIGVTQTLFESWIKGVGSCAMTVWEVNPGKKLVSIQNVGDSSLIQAAKKLQVVENLLFVLDNEDVLSLWDFHSLTLIWECPAVAMEEFLLTSESDFSAGGGGLGNANLKLVALTTPDHIEQMKSIVVFALPAMHQLYALEVTPVSTLVQSVINTDTIYFMEGMYENNQKSSADPVSFLLMRSLTEALPENRLSRLLHKHKFAEAESFALQFGLEIELVYKVKANTILERLASGCEDQSAWLKLVLQAKETLNKIKDNSFVVRYCIHTPWPTYETTQEMLNYARMAILKKENASVTHFMNVDPASLLTEVLQTQAKLTTFYGAFGPEKYSGTTWLEFLNNKNIVGYILVQLRGGNLSSAQYLWLRHQAELESSFSQEMLDDLLESVPGMLQPLQGLALWLKQVVLPFVRQVLPHGQKRVAKWLEERARSLELTDKANWPENGLELAQVFFTSKDVGDIELASFSHWDFLKDSEDKEIHRLMDLVNALQDLVDLYRKYNCRLALCDFEKETTNTIVFRMLDKILAAELIPVALEKYIEPYMRHHHLEKDEILLRYIKDLLLWHCKQSSSVFDTSWEAKAIAVLGCMSDLELIFEGVLAIMHSAVVPWSPGVEDLVQRYLGMEHARVKLLEEGYRLMEMKKLLRSYGIRDTNLLNDKQMILMLAKHILKQDTLSALGDALKIIKAYMLPTAEVYVWKIADLIDKEKGEDVLDLLKSLPPSEAMEIAERILIWGKIELEEEVDTLEEKKMHLQLKRALVEILKFLLGLQKENRWQKEEREKDLENFRILVTLQESFDICLSLKDFCDPSRTAQLLEEHIRAYEKAKRCGNHQGGGETKLGDPSAKEELIPMRLYRLGILLQKSEVEMGAELAFRALDDGKVKEALQICSYFYESHHNEEAGQLLFLVSQKLCHMLGSNIPMVLPEGQDLPDIIYYMACQAATLCSPDLFLDILEFCKYTSFACEIYAKCQMEDFGFIPQATCLDTDKDPYGDWTFEDFFTEDGSVLDTPAVLPFAYKIASSLVPLAEWKASPLESASLPYCPFEQGRNRCRLCKHTIFALLTSLQEGSQCELALGLICYSFGSLFRHMISNNVNDTLSKKLHGQKMLEEACAFPRAVMQNLTSVIQGIATALLHKVFNSHHVDHQLAFGYCTLLPRTVIFGKLWDIVNQTSQNYKKILAVAIVGTQLAVHYEDPQEKQAFGDLVTDAEWGIELGKLGISFQNIFRTPSVRKKELLRTLVQHPKADTSLILKFCRTFHLGTDAPLQFYIETQFQGDSQGRGESEQGAGKEPHVLAVARAVDTIPLLSSTTGLVTSLSAMLHKVDPYNYETIGSLLTVMETAGGQATGFPLNRAKMLLKHLKSYKRSSPPGDLEQQFLFDQEFCLSPAAQTRLPFHLIFFKTSQCFWKIISAEINQESFPKLLLICKVMKVSLDNLHVSALNHIFREMKPKLVAATTSGQLWPVDKRTEETMQAVQSYLLSNTKPEWAAALVHQIAQELPTGPIKVQTLKICLGLAEKWLKDPTITDESREKARVHLKRLQGQHKKAAMEALLAAQKLNSEDHQKLLGKPTNLILLLYQHASIVERIQNPTGRDYPDIHAAAREIAQINNLELKKIWDALLERWLCPNVLPTGEASEGSESVQEDEDLKRIIYLLQLYPVDNQLRILYEFAVSPISPIGVNQLTFAHRSRALRCLLFLADPAVIESLFKTPMRKVRNFLKCFIYLAQLEALNIPYTYESFHRTSKEGMIKGLWKNHSHEPKAVKLVAQLSLDYKVHDPLLWNGLLQKLMGFKMVHYLRKVLVEISGIYSLWPISNYSRAWQSVILAPILSALGPPNLDQLEACCGSFKMLLRCPVLADLDLTGIAKRFAQLDLTGLALGCLVLIPQWEKRAQQIQAFLSSSDLEQVLQQTEKHLSPGEAAGVASQVRSSILDHILHQAKEDLAEVKYFPLLRLRERHPGQVKGLVEKLVAKDRMEDAASLITEYLQKPEMSLLSKQTASEVVKRYLSELEPTLL